MNSRFTRAREHMMHAIGFTDADLKSNRVGRLSDRQRKELQQAQSQSALKWWILIGSLAVPLILTTGSPWLQAACFNQFGGLLIAAVIAAFYEQSKMRGVLKHGGVSIVEGVLNKRGPQLSLKKNGPRSLYIEERRFAVSSDVFDSLHDQAFYRLYFVETTAFLKGKVLKLIAAELLDEPETYAHLSDEQFDEDEGDWIENASRRSRSR